MSPFFTVIFTALLLKETVALPRIFLFITAFIGSLLILKPSLSGWRPPLRQVAMAVYNNRKERDSVKQL